MKFRLLFFFLLVPLLSMVSAQQKALFEVASSNPEEAKPIFEEISKLILENYYYDGISETDLYWAAIDGLLERISPPDNPDLARLWTDAEYARILNSLKGKKVSFGFTGSFDGADGSLKVTSIIDDTDAAGKLQLHDRIVRIDGKALRGLNTSQVNELLEGEEGSSSKFTVVRDIDVFEVNVERSEVVVQNIQVARIPNRPLAFIEIKSVSLGIAEQLEQHLAELTADGVTGIILDLRNNQGGILNEGINIAKLFLRRSNIVLRTQSRSSGITNYAASEDKYVDLDLMILVNENTASASEIVTAAMQDHARASIIGKKTFGKGVIETTFTLSNNYRVKFITSAMYSPKGVSWQSKGLLPDYFIDQTPASLESVNKMQIDDRVRNDLHLSTAIKLLSN